MKPYALIALLALSLQFSNPCSSKNTGSQPTPQDEVFEVDVLSTKFTNKPRVYDVSGTFDFGEMVEIKANADGTLDKLYISVGDRVEKGDPVFNLANSDLVDEIELKRARIKEYNSRITLAESKIDDADANDTTPTITQDDIEFLDEDPVDKPIEKNFDAPETNGTQTASPRTQRALALVLENLIERLTKEAEVLDKRLLALNHTTPIDGVITQTFFSEGNKAKMQDTVVQIATTNPMTVTFDLPENLANFVNKRTKIEIVLEGAGDTPNPTGRVFFISPNLNEDTKTITLKAHVDNPTALIKGGQTAIVKVISNKMDRVLKLPTSALIKEDKKNFVFIVQGQKARLIEIKNVVEQNDEFVLVQANLSVGDLIVTNPSDDLKNGSFVKVLTDDTKDATQPTDKPESEK